MTVYYQQGAATIHNGDCLEVLRTLPDESVQCCVTSPPYWGLRDYGHDGQIGLEETPEAYVSRLVAVFREVRRVLKADGTLWLNLGDSYANGGPSGPQGASGDRASRAFTAERLGAGCLSHGLKPKDLVGIPWRVAFALQADGWWLRQDIIWHKPNPMPESVTDRCTKAHEYIFLLSKSEKYFFDNEAMREPATKGPQRMQADLETARRRSVGPMARGEEGFNHQYADPDRVWAADGKRNRRSVWTVTTKPFNGAHFATMPTDLVEPCILAGCPEGGTVLDPFNGAATVGLVALNLQRKYLGIELNPEYCELSVKRIDGVARQKRLFAGVTA